MSGGIGKRGAVLACAGAALLAAALSAPAVRAATPVADCNTPNQSGGTGIMLTPANPTTSGGQYLTKTGIGFNSVGNAYDFRLTSVRAAGSSFAEFTDCAYSTINGNPAAPAYNDNHNNPTFTFNPPDNPNCSCWESTFAETVAKQSNGQPDSICDRVQVKGTDGSTGLPFTDYSNVVLSTASGQQSFPGSATSCTPSSDVPELPVAAAVIAASGGAAGAIILVRRRKNRDLAAV